MKCKGIGRNTTLRFTAIAAALMMAGCQQAAEESAAVGQVSPEPTVSEAALPDPARSPFDPKKDARQMQRDRLGAEYCLVRNVPDGRDGVMQTRTPLIGLPNGGNSHRLSLNPLRIVPVDEATYCSAEMWLKRSDSVQVLRSKGRARLLVTRAGEVIMDREVSSPSGFPDAFLSGHATCNDGPHRCEGLEGLDAYVYALDVGGKDGHVAKVLKVDLFYPEGSDPGNDPGKCDAERPDRPGTIRLRSEVAEPCDGLPDWVRDLNQAYAGSIDVEPKQTGTGSGYEPP